MLTELCDRGILGPCMVGPDGQKGLPEAVRTLFGGSRAASSSARFSARRHATRTGKTARHASWQLWPLTGSDRHALGGGELSRQRGRSADPWAWIDEHFVPVDGPIRGPVVGMLFIGLALVGSIWAASIAWSLAGGGIAGHVEVTQVLCHMTPRGESCSHRGDFFSHDGSVTLRDVDVQLEAPVGTRVAARATALWFSKNEFYVGAPDPLQLLWAAMVTLLGWLAGGAWLVSAILRVAGGWRSTRERSRGTGAHGD